MIFTVFYRAHFSLPTLKKIRDVAITWKPWLWSWTQYGNIDKFVHNNHIAGYVTIIVIWYLRCGVNICDPVKKWYPVTGGWILKENNTSWLHHNLEMPSVFTSLFMRGIHWFSFSHDAVIKWKHFPRYWPFVRGIHRSPVNFPHKGQWRGALMFSLICVLIDGWVNNREAGGLRRYRGLYDVTVMTKGQ